MKRTALLNMTLLARFFLLYDLFFHVPSPPLLPHSGHGAVNLKNYENSRSSKKWTYCSLRRFTNIGINLTSISLTDHVIGIVTERWNKRCIFNKHEGTVLKLIFTALTVYFIYLILALELEISFLIKPEYSSSNISILNRSLFSWYLSPVSGSIAQSENGASGKSSNDVNCWFSSLIVASVKNC